MSNYIYVISNGTSYKVGFSKDPARRVKQLQTGNPNKLELVYYIEIEVAPVKILETIVHKNLKFNKIKGEWFKADFETLKTELDFVKIRYDNEDTERDYILGILDFNA